VAGCHRGPHEADARQALNHAATSLRRTRANAALETARNSGRRGRGTIEQKERFAQLIVAEAGKPWRIGAD